MIGTPWHNVVMMKVISSESIPDASGRWSYVVQVVNFGPNASDVPEVAASPLPVPTEYTAYNLYEYANTTTSHMGVTVPIPGTNFELKPIPDNTIVPAFWANGLAADTTSTDGSLVMLLWPNQFDGAC